MKCCASNLNSFIVMRENLAMRSPISAIENPYDYRRKLVMKLFYTPGACSLSPHIALHEAGLTHEIVKVNLQTQMTETGQDFRTINSKGQIPALMLDGGELLTEGPVIVQFIADKAPAANLAP